MARPASELAATAGLWDGGRLALLARECPEEPPSYCVFGRFREGRVQAIRDYRYARHVFAEAEWSAAGKRT